LSGPLIFFNDTGVSSALSSKITCDVRIVKKAKNIVKGALLKVETQAVRVGNERR